MSFEFINPIILPLNIGLLHPLDRVKLFAEIVKLDLVTVITAMVFLSN